MASMADHPLTACGSGEYSADKLRELRLNALNYSGKKVGDGEAPGNAPTIKLSGTFKVAAAKDDRYEMGSSIAVVSILVSLTC